MELSAEEVRVLGSLIEKELTTPDQYPMSTNSLRLACNQKTNREPVVDYTEVEVDQAMLRLRQAGLARTVSGQGMRTSKHRQVLGEALGLDKRTLALLGVLMVRGPQTVGELRTRTDRAAGFESLSQIEAILGDLAARAPEPLVKRLERRPGQKEERWAHLLAGDEIDETVHAATPRPRPMPGAGPGRDELVARVDGLERTVAALTAQLASLCEQLGVEVEAAAPAPVGTPTGPAAGTGWA